jgi:hypothetical protein
MMSDLILRFTELLWKMKIHFAFPDPSSGYDISIEQILFYSCYAHVNEYTVEIVDNPCTSAGLVVPEDINSGGTFDFSFSFVMGDTDDIDFTGFTNGECTYELELLSINSETDSTLWPAIYTLAQPTFTSQTAPAIDDDRIVDLTQEA